MIAVNLTIIVPREIDGRNLETYAAQQVYDWLYKGLKGSGYEIIYSAENQDWIILIDKIKELKND